MMLFLFADLIKNFKASSVQLHQYNNILNCKATITGEKIEFKLRYYLIKTIL
jgi:hypothetical protein